MQPSPVASLLKQWLLTVWNSLSYFSLLLSPLTARIPLPNSPLPSLQLRSSPTSHSHMLENNMQSQSTSAIQTFRHESKVRTNYSATFILPRFLNLNYISQVTLSVTTVLFCDYRIGYYKHMNAISNKIYFQVQVSLPITFSGVYMKIYKSYNVYVITFVLQSISDSIKAYWWTFWNYSYCKAAKYMVYIWKKPCLIRLGICPSNYNFFYLLVRFHIIKIVVK